MNINISMTLTRIFIFLQKMLKNKNLIIRKNYFKSATEKPFRVMSPSRDGH